MVAPHGTTSTELPAEPTTALQTVAAAFSVRVSGGMPLSHLVGQLEDTAKLARQSDCHPNPVAALCSGIRHPMHELQSSLWDGSFCKVRPNPLVGRAV